MKVSFINRVRGKSLKVQTRQSYLFNIAVMIFILLLAACNTNVPEEEETQSTAVIEVATSTVIPTETSVPVPEPVLEKVVLSVPLEAQDDLYQEVLDFLLTWTAGEGYVLDVREAVAMTDIQEDWLGVVFLKAPANLNEIQEANPDLNLLVLSEDSLTGNGNLSVIQLNRLHQTFVAGYVGVLAAQDWRLGGLLPWDDAETGTLLQEAFVNGAAYYCGRCASVYMPVTLFPVISSLSSNSNSDDWLNAYTTLNQSYIVYVMYLSSEAGSDEVIRALSEQNVVMIGEEIPPEGVQEWWAATISMDVMGTIQMVLPEAFSGNGGQTVIVPVQINDINEELLSVGRMRLIDDTIALLTKGELLPLSPDYP